MLVAPVARPALVVVTLLACCVLAPLPAQGPSAWSVLTPPSPFVPGAVRVSARLVMYRSGDYLRVFSAVTRRWHAIGLSFGTTPQLFADLLLVPESDRWTAFSAWRGVAEPLFVGQASTSMTASGGIALVRDGAAVHAFSSYTGRWHPHTAPAAWIEQLSDRMLLLRSPATAGSVAAAAFDLYTGQWHDLAPVAGLLQGAWVTGATALLKVRLPDGRQQLCGFSAQHPTWALDIGASGGASDSNLQGDGDVLVAGNRAFSGLNGAFAAAPAAVTALTAGGFVALADDAQQYHASSAAHGAWTPLPAGARPASSMLRPALQLFALPGQTIAYDALTGQLASVGIGLGHPYPSGQHGSAAGVTAGISDIGNGAAAVYSALTGRWYAPPAGSFAELPAVARAGALLRTGSGLSAFSARTGSFTPLAGSNLSPHVGGAAMLAVDGSSVYAFDARSERWLLVPAAPLTWSPAFGDSTAVALAGYQAVGFSARTGRLEAIATSVVRSTQASGDVGCVVTGSQIQAFGGLPAVTAWMPFPESTPACAIGTTFRQQIRLGNGEVALFAFGQRAPQPVALPFGELWLDPAATTVTLQVPPGGEQRALIELPIPASPALRGSEWWQQALVVPAQGAAWLSEPDTLRIL